MIEPYTPASLDRIRAGASARDLGWDEKTYAERCHKHGLTPNVAVQPSATSLPKAVEPPRRRARTLFPDGEAYTVSMPHSLRCAVIDYAEGCNLSPPQVVRDALDIALKREGQPPTCTHRYPGAVDSYLTATMSQSMLAALRLRAEGLQISRTEFTRRVLAQHIRTVQP